MSTDEEMVGSVANRAPGRLEVAASSSVANSRGFRNKSRTPMSTPTVGVCSEPRLVAW